MVPEAQNAKAADGEVRIAFPVLAALRVLTAIDFDDQARFEAGEIGDVFADRNLAPELQAIEASVAETIPQAAFGVGPVAAHLLRMTALPRPDLLADAVLQGLRSMLSGRGRGRQRCAVPLTLRA